MDLLFVNGQYEFNKTINISEESFYSDVTVEDKIPCEVTYDEHGIIDIKVTVSTIEQYSEAKGRNGLIVVSALMIITLGAVAVGCIIGKE